MASSHAKLPRLFRSALPPIAQNQLILGFLKDSSKGGSGRSHFAFLGTYLREKRALCVGGGSAQMCGADQHRPQPPPRPLRCETPPIDVSVCLLSLLHTHLHCSIQYTLVAKLAGLAGIM